MSHEYIEEQRKQVRLQGTAYVISSKVQSDTSAAFSFSDGED